MTPNYCIIQIGDVMELSYTQNAVTEYTKVIHVLKSELNLSTRLINKLKSTDKIFKNNTLTRVVDPISDGDTIRVVLDEEEENDLILSENIPLDIIYEDDYLIAVNKQAGMVVHPTTGHPNGTMANALKFHFLSSGLKTLIRPINRLDRDTSGVVIFAKHSYVQEFIIRQMKNNACSKVYLALLEGNFPIESGTINRPIARKPGSIMLREINPNGETAITHFKVLKHYNDTTLLKVWLETGRTHQIRVHFSSEGFPLVGDSLYGEGNSNKIGRQALHSFQFGFVHPGNKKFIRLTAKLHDDYKKLLIYK